MRCRITVALIILFAGLFAKAEVDSESDLETKPKTKKSSEKSSSHSGKIKPWSCSNCFWLGGGAHYLMFQQKAPKNLEPIDYQSFGAPSIWTEFRFKLFGGLGITGEYQSQSGADLKTKTLNLKNTKINWNYSTVGFDYRFRQHFKLFGKPVLPRLLLAYQMHSMPFLKQQTDGTFSIEPLQFNTLSLGGYFDIQSSATWHFFLTNRLQVPIQSQSKIQVQQGLSFDGALGAVYHFNPNVAWAFFWGGQYHGLKYKTDQDEGNYTLLTSKINTLVGFYF